MRRSALRACASASLSLFVIAASHSPAQSVWENLDGRLGALAPENLAAHAEKSAPTDFTGTYTIVTSTWQFPVPEGLKPEYREMFQRSEAARQQGLVFNNDVGQCWPPGLPMMMNRVWPINLIQLPTSLVIIANFENQVRWIFMDGREHSDPDLYVPSYNGESIGHWDGNSLIVDSRNFEPGHHWVRDGIPVSPEFRVIERFTLNEDGSRLSIEYTMTDPNIWEGEWVHTKVYNREHRVDFVEVHCLPNTNEGIPATNEAYQVRE